MIVLQLEPQATALLRVFIFVARVSESLAETRIHHAPESAWLEKVPVTGIIRDYNTATLKIQFDS